MAQSCARTSTCCLIGAQPVRVLVTGGAGFVGSTTSAALIAAGHHVTVLDNLSTGRRQLIPEGVELLEGDVTNRDVVDAAVRHARPEACMHFASLIEAGASMHEAARYLAVNTGGSLTLLDVLHRHGVERFVLSSTAAVYGEPESVPILEDAPTRPTNPYGASKLLVEQALTWHARSHGLRFAALRYFNAAGATPNRPELHSPETHLIPIVLEVAEGRRDAVRIFGDDYPTPDGTAVRDYVHVADLAAAHVIALERLDELGTLTCNLGSGTGFSVSEVIETARRVTGHAIPAENAPRRAGDPAMLVASSILAREQLDWHPAHTDLDTIIADAWQYRVGGN